MVRLSGSHCEGLAHPVADGRTRPASRLALDTTRKDTIRLLDIYRNVNRGCCVRSIIDGMVINMIESKIRTPLSPRKTVPLKGFETR